MSVVSSKFSSFGAISVKNNQQHKDFRLHHHSPNKVKNKVINAIVIVMSIPCRLLYSNEDYKAAYSIAISRAYYAYSRAWSSWSANISALVMACSSSGLVAQSIGLVSKSCKSASILNYSSRAISISNY